MVKNYLAEKMHHVAEAFCENAADQEVPSGIARYGKQASEWIDKSAIYVEQFDIEQADARVRDLVRRNPGRSILIAGGVGLLVGMVLRRR